jgi:hypothetical protein
MIRRLFAVLLLVAGALIPPFAAANTLYVSTAQREAGPGVVRGHLYTVDSSSGRSKLVGPIRIGGILSVGVTGLAVHPQTKVLYGITKGSHPSIPPSLVTIDPTTAAATMVGLLGIEGSDINFDSHGTLYIWLAGEMRLGTVDLVTGRVSPMGALNAAAPGGGLAIDKRGAAFVASSSTGLDHIDVRTGRRFASRELHGAPFAGAINSLSFSPTGILVGINSDATTSKAELVMINAATGAVTAMGPLPDDADGLTFFRDAASASSAGTPKLGLFYSVLLLLLGLSLVGAVRWRVKR